MTDNTDPLIEEVLQAAFTWAEARRNWEASSRETSRPGNYGELKGNVRRAERLLLSKVHALELIMKTEQEQKSPAE